MIYVPGFIVIENSPFELVRIVLFATETVADCKTISSSFTFPFMMPFCAKEARTKSKKNKISALAEIF